MLLHITTVEAWAGAQALGVYRAASLASAGFIHLSSESQWRATGERLFRGRRDLLLLVIDPARLVAEVRWEDGVPPAADGAQFPHLYGALNLDAVTAALPLPVAADGAIGVPAGLG